MSYCVNCGVELTDDARKCPLCNVPVINPSKPQTTDAARAYPKRIEQIMNHIDVRYGVWLASLFLLIPAGITLLCNIIIDHSMTWSAYVIGGCLCLFVWVLLPFLQYRRDIYSLIIYDGTAALLYLALISGMTSDFVWFLPLALPLVLLTTFFLLFAVFFCRRKKIGFLYKFAVTEFVFALYVVFFEIILDFFVSDAIYFNWSLYIALVCVVTAVIFIVIAKKQRFRDEIRRRLFM